MATYNPLLSKEEIEERRIWQAETYQKLKSIKEKQTVNVLGKEIIVLPGLFAPVFEDSKFLAQAVRDETKDCDVVLDLGTGTGIQGVFAAEKASKVISVDVNPIAVECARLNAHHHHIKNKMKVFESDLFSNINEKFDLIIFNPPFRWFKPRDILERGELDENYSTLNKFFSEAENYLKERGRILLVFSSSGDLKYLERLISNSVFSSKIVKQETFDRWTYVVYRLS